MHSKMQSHAAQKQSGLRSCYSSNGLLVTKVDLTMCLLVTSVP